MDKHRGSCTNRGPGLAGGGVHGEAHLRGERRTNLLLMESDGYGGIWLLMGKRGERHRRTAEHQHTS